MIAITLGLVAVAAAMTIYLANRKSFALVEGVARMQENARFAVDLLSRDIRAAGGAVCGGSLVSVNIVPDTNTWSIWDRGLVGNVLGANQLLAPSGSTAKISTPVTDSLLVWNASSSGAPVQIVSHAVGAAGSFTTASASGYVVGQVITACDSLQLITFEVSAISGNIVSYGNGDAVTTPLSPGGFLSPLSAHVWYVGGSTDTAAASSSLRRLTIDKAGSYVNDNEEIVVNVKNMQIQYLVGNSDGAPVGTDYVVAASVTDWTKVIAARITLTLATKDTVGTTGSSETVVGHSVPFTVGIRRRMP